jgi:hypothetical protein
VLLNRVPNTWVAAFPDCPPVTEELNAGAFHEYKVVTGIIPSTTSTGDIAIGTPLQVVTLNELTAGKGLTVTINVNGFPTPQSGEVGVTV